MAISREDLPKHVAIVMDGNGRWAQQRQCARIVGHRAGVLAARNAIKIALELKISVLTLFAFSSENWQRPAQEINYLMYLFKAVLQKEVVSLHENNIKLRIIGDRERLDRHLQSLIADAEQMTECNTGLVLVLAVNYGGRWDIVQATKAIAEQVSQGAINLDEINEDLVRQQLVLADVPPPDLFIRTSGEQRISNFLIWQLAYTELIFMDCYWPDFNKEMFLAAIKSYQQRDRCYGMTREQAQSA